MHPSLALDWVAILARLDCSVTQLPAATLCPRCHSSQMYLYEDVRSVSGPWAACHGCELYGDIIEVAAACWKLDPGEATLQLISQKVRLSATLLTEQGRAAMQLVWQRRRHIQQFVNQITANFASTQPRIDELIGRLAGITGMDPSWRHNCGRLFGQTTIAELLAFSAELRGRVSWEAVRDADPATPVLAIPSYDMPGRVVGFTALRLTARDAVRKAYLPLRHGGNLTGIGNLGAWHTPPHTVLGDRMFILSRPSTFIRLLVRHHRLTSAPLPVLLVDGVGSQDKARRIGRGLVSRPCVVVGAERDVLELTRLAYLARGGVALHRELGPNACADPVQFLGHVMQHVCPWQIRLTTLLKDCDITTAVTRFRGMGLTAGMAQKYLQDCPKELQQRLQRGDIKACIRNSISVDGDAVTYDHEGWKRGDQLICDADIHFQRQVFLKNGELWYYGHAIRGDRMWPIEYHPQPTWGLFQQVATQLQAYGEQFTYRPEWNWQAHRIATLLHPPEVQRNCDQVGWDTDSGLFRLPQFTLGMGGTVRCEPFTHYPPKIPTPAAAIPPPSIISGHDLDELRRQSGNHLFWALLAAVMQNVFAPALNLKPASIVLANTGRATIGRQLAAALCNAPCELGSYNAGGKPYPVLGHHTWPIYACTPLRNASLAEWVATHKSPLIIESSPVFASVLGTYGWTVLDCDNGWTISPAALQTAVRVASAYMQDLCRRHGKGHTQARDSREFIHTDLATWYRIIAGEPLRVEHVRRQAIYGPHTPRWFGLIDTVWRFKHTRPNPYGLLREYPAGIGLNLEILSRMLRARHWAPVDVEALRLELTELGALLSPELPDGTYGWIIDRAWWNKHYTLSRSSRLTPYQLPAENNARRRT